MRVSAQPLARVVGADGRLYAEEPIDEGLVAGPRLGRVGAKVRGRDRWGVGVRFGLG